LFLTGTLGTIARHFLNVILFLTGTLGTFFATDKDLTSPNNEVTFESAGGDTSYMYLLGDGTVSRAALKGESG